MADKFECDSCKELFNPSEKRGTIELTAIGHDSMPHMNFHGKLDLCKSCFDRYQKQFEQINPLLKPFRG